MEKWRKTNPYEVQGSDSLGDECCFEPQRVERNSIIFIEIGLSFSIKSKVKFEFCTVPVLWTNHGQQINQTDGFRYLL